MTPAQRARAAEHIIELGRRHTIKVRRVSTWEKAAARPDLRVVWVPRVRTKMDYVVALHEFGHVLDRRAARLYAREGDEPADTANEIVMEAAAWAWALKHLDRTVVGEMSEPLRREIGRCWASALCIRYFRPRTHSV